MIVIMNAVKSDPDGLMSVCLGFEVAAAHRFFFHEIMSVPNNLLRLDKKRVGKTCDCCS